MRLNGLVLLAVRPQTDQADLTEAMAGMTPTT